jgi:hypothetical protein
VSWKKGQSGNPNGRPKGFAEVKALALSMCSEGIEAVHKLAKAWIVPLSGVALR